MVIIKAAKTKFNSDKICRSYCDFYFGVTFLEHTVEESFYRMVVDNLDILTDHYFVLSQSMRLTDRWTDRKAI